MKTGSSETLGFATKLGFGVGDLYGGGSLVIIGFFYLYFLTDVLLIDPFNAGLVVFVSKAWDAVSDPIMGYISDNTRTRFGRRRPYFIAGVPLIFLSFFVMWYPVDFSQEWQRMAFVMIGYVFFSTVITMVMIPYNALTAELTLDYNERTSLTTYRIFFSSLSSLLCAVLPLKIISLYPDVRSGYIAMALIFGAMFALPFIITFLVTRERTEFQSAGQSVSVLRSYVEPFRVPTFINVLVMYIMAFVAMDLVSAIVIYFMTYYLGRGGETDTVLGILLIMQIVSLPVYYAISRRSSKKRGYIAAALVWIAAMCTSFFITPEQPRVFVYLFSGVVGLGTGGVVIMIYAIFPDMPDVDELYSGRRREGMFSGIFTFTRKLSSAFSLLIVSAAIKLAGYRPPVRRVAEGVTEMVKQPQTEGFITVLRVVFFLVPAVFLVLALIFAFRYPLTPELHGRLKALLERRRKVDGAVDPEEEATLKGVIAGRRS
ncbi:MAG: MFS transporter [Spirochaetes bacterium]|nr:MFS transporter [Spirochaetota bacterium]